MILLYIAMDPETTQALHLDVILAIDAVCNRLAPGACVDAELVRVSCYCINFSELSRFSGINDLLNYSRFCFRPRSC